MIRLRVSAATILLIGCSAAQADEATAGRTYLKPESELERGWAADLQRPSSIRIQANAVMATQRPEIPVETVRVASLDAEPSAIRDGNGSEGCIFMENPGSRIREWRCYYPSEGEKALNAYQFQEELRYAIDLQDQLELQRQAADAMRSNYAKMFRRR